MKIKTSYIISALLLLIGLGIGFFGGTKYQQGKVAGAATSGQNRGRFGNGNGIGGRATAGEIISKDDKSITVKMQDGSTKIVLLSSSTTINKASEGSVGDLTTGERVAVFGTTNSDGSVTAQNIQINPLIRNGQSPMPSSTPF